MSDTNDRTPSKPLARIAALPSLKPALREGAELLRQTITPPSEGAQRGRMAVFAALCAAALGACYLLTGRMIWAFVMLIVGVPLVALPSFILVGMVRQARGRSRGAEPKSDGHTSV